MTSREAALQAVRAYVAQERPYCHVTGLVEDESDFLAELALNPGMQWPVGPGPLFVSKATGEVWSDAYGAVMEKIGRMR